MFFVISKYRLVYSFYLKTLLSAKDIKHVTSFRITDYYNLFVEVCGEATNLPQPTNIKC